MVLAEKDEPGVGGQTKRFFSEAMKVEVHLKLPLESPGTPSGLSDYTDSKTGLHRFSFIFEEFLICVIGP
jgi:hypothetical protein